MAVWLALLLATLAGPYAFAAADPGDLLIRNTIRLALFYYFLTLNALLWPTIADEDRRATLARGCWTMAWLTYLVHLAMAFHFYHHWSHADAVRHTEEVSGFGPGIYVSHLFTVLWGADVAAWWLTPAWHARRSPWLGRLLHAFMLFVVFNGTVVYETGFIRWAGPIAFVELAAVALWRLQANSRH